MHACMHIALRLKTYCDKLSTLKFSELPDPTTCSLKTMDKQYSYNTQSVTLLRPVHTDTVAGSTLKCSMFAEFENTQCAIELVL